MEVLKNLGVLAYLLLLIFTIVWILLPFYVRRVAIESKRHTEILKAIHKQLKHQNKQLRDTPDSELSNISEKDVDDFLNKGR